jgi:hypothetical protein
MECQPRNPSYTTDTEAAFGVYRSGKVNSHTRQKAIRGVLVAVGSFVGFILMVETTDDINLQ